MPAIDRTAPVLTGLSLPQTIDLRGKSANVFTEFGFTASASDVGAGVLSIALHLDRNITSFELTTRDLRLPHDGRAALGTPHYVPQVVVIGDSYIGNYSLPGDLPGGTYNVVGATVVDRMGNTTDYSLTQLTAAGFATSFQVLSDASADTIAPVLTGITIPDIDISRNPYPSVSIAATDAGVGVDSVALTFDRLVGTSNVVTIANPQRPGLDATSFSALFPLTAQSFSGDYHILTAVVTDRVGNARTYSGAELAAQGIDTNVVVSGGNNTDPTVDHAGPVLTGFNLPEFTSLTAHQFLQGAISATDASGIAQAKVNFSPAIQSYTSASGADHSFTANVSSGQFGEYLPKSTGSGHYTITSVDLLDNAGNSTTYTTTDLGRLGLSTGFTVGNYIEGDTDGDGRSDIVWASRSQISIWSSAGWAGTGSSAKLQFSENSYLAAHDPGWSADGTFDMNGDGRADVIWRNTNGQLSIWTGITNGFDQAAYNGAASISWKIAGAGDFNGDGKDDLLWRNDNGAVSVWSSTGNDFAENSLSSRAGTNWHINGIDDFNGDGRDDILWRADNGAVSIWSGTPTGFVENSFSHVPVGLDWKIAGTGNFDLDARADIIWRNDDGRVSEWQSTGTGFSEGVNNASASTDWTIQQIADVDFNGYDDLIWQNSSGAVAIWAGLGGAWYPESQSAYFHTSVASDWSIVAHFPIA